ncbi:MAG: MoaD/ThiS family protein [Cellvibrionales bacterium]|nr:MoaD/ThiS family protein [Cellvibrionales bacterium]
MISLTIDYFAELREQAGHPSEERQTNARNAADLYAELAHQYGFRLAAADVKVAINEEFAAMDTPLTAGDRVVFLPPVSGG